MAAINQHFLKLSAGYLFPEIARRVSEFAAAHPALATNIIRCGIGDVTEPLPPAAVRALHEGADDLAHRDRFQGYGPPSGHAFVREAIARTQFRDRGIDVADDEIFLSDGSKPDASHFLEIMGAGNRIAVPDPVYPVYVETNVMAGNTGAADADGRYEGLLYLPSTPQNHFVPSPPRERADLVYLCFPNNPTGATISREGLKAWVDWARQHDALILFDAAYEAYVRDPAVPRSIFEIDGARSCAVEFRSFSKNGGFTGVRCGYTVVPKSVTGTAGASRVPLHGLWMRRWSTCSNGVSWPVQKAVAAMCTAEGEMQMRALTDFYLHNAGILRGAVQSMGLRCWGGDNAPYVWVKCPEGMGSWQAFDRLLHDGQLVITPGVGFGSCGEGFIRVSAFNSRANIVEAGARLRMLVTADSTR